ncbi:type II toxin-antitoxin system RelE family toxin [Bacillus cereus]|uniref:type II toxin-antitoxin system RelE family toxin n=1 Tax=Bacillus cereus TaxID=1396 RepID=UPI0002792EBB|nr:hypothetical protein [Bacillus cereus]EJQ20146.1 hypothetical protein IE5_03463 [Bacillus cereus BAG3X2-2]WMW36760.1 hypothetical protein RE433_17930 [Bacillus cereus]SME15177.1 hypothetical protein BACERE00195_03149 [Bacillus cereus]
MDYELFLNQQLNPHNVEVKFGKNALQDIKSYDKRTQNIILTLLIKRGKSGPLIKPNGLGEPLRGKLSGFTKIKYSDLNLRIVYRPLENGLILMEVIAIGPRDKKKVYTLAANRVSTFQQEMASHG